MHSKIGELLDKVGIIWLGVIRLYWHSTTTGALIMHAVCMMERTHAEYNNYTVNGISISLP